MYYYSHKFSDILHTNVVNVSVDRTHNVEEGLTDCCHLACIIYAFSFSVLDLHYSKKEKESNLYEKH